MIDVKTIKLQDYFNLLQDREVTQIIFLKGYFQIFFDRCIISCFSEAFIKTPDGSFQIPSKQGNWDLFQLLGKQIIVCEERDNEVILKAENDLEIAVNTRLGPLGDTFHISIEGLPTLHF